MSSSTTTLKLTVNERIILYLLEYWKYYDESIYPVSITQRGIAHNVSILPEHIPRSLKQLKAEQLIEEKKGRVHNTPRKIYVYFLTEKGKKLAESLKEKYIITNVPVILDDGTHTIMPLKEVIRLTKYPGFYPYIKQLLEKNQINLKELSFRKPDYEKHVELWFNAPKIENFINRQRETTLLRELLTKTDYKLISILGNSGYGKSALLYKTVHEIKSMFNIFWYTIAPTDQTWHVIDGLSKFLLEFGKPRLATILASKEEFEFDEVMKLITEDLSDTDSLLIFDEYHNISDDLMDFFYYFVQALYRISRIKVIIPLRETTPAYHRFYGTTELQKNLVREMKIKGLDEPSSKLLLGNRNIDNENFRQTYLLTKGVPRTLIFIRDNDVENLKRHTRFTMEEIKLLLFWTHG